MFARNHIYIQKHMTAGRGVRHCLLPALSSRGMLGEEFLDFGKEIDPRKSCADQELLSATILGLGLWRLNCVIRPKMALLASRLEGIIRQCCLTEDLEVSPVGDFEYWDTLDPQGRKDDHDPFFATTQPDPEKFHKGFPRLQIENRVYSTRVFRKIHIELAARQDGLQVFHLVMYPFVTYDLPILCMDMVANKDTVRFAICDTAPVRCDKSLPDFYLEAVKRLQRNFIALRVLPQWGREILSNSCVSLRPSNSAETGRFIQYCCCLTRLHLEIAALAKPIPPHKTHEIEEIATAHKRFCTHQCENHKTTMVLTAAFGKDAAYKYLKEFMFDVA